MGMNKALILNFYPYFRIQQYSSVVDQLRAMSASPAVNKVLLPRKYSYSGGVSYAIMAAVSIYIYIQNALLNDFLVFNHEIFNFILNCFLI